MRKVEKNDKGFSLVEVLIVILIMTIITSLALISYSVVSSARISNAGKNLQSVISEARTQSMAKGTNAGKLTLTMENGNLYAQVGDVATASKEEISSGRMQIYYVTNDYSSTTGLQISDGDVLEISFNTDGTVRKIDDTGAAINVPTNFLFENSSRRMQVVLYLETGKCRTGLY